MFDQQKNMLECMLKQQQSLLGQSSPVTLCRYISLGIYCTDLSVIAAKAELLIRAPNLDLCRMILNRRYDRWI